MLGVGTTERVRDDVPFREVTLNWDTLRDRLPRVLHRDRLVEILGRNRVFAIVRECSRDLPFPVYVAGSTISYAVWGDMYGIPKAPDDLDLVFFDRGSEFAHDVLKQRVEDCLGVPVQAYNQAKVHEIPKFSYRPARTSIEDAVANYCDTPACVAVRRLDDGDFGIIAPHGLSDLFSGCIRVTAHEYTTEVINRARKKQWQRTWPEIRVVDEYGVPLVV